MKVLCVACNEPMKFGGAEGSGGDNTATLAFVCRKCGNSVAMQANQKEGELIRSLGIKVAEREAPHTTGKIQGTVSWDEDAEAHLSNVPEFVRPMAKAGVERYASQKGYKSITTEVMAEARKVYGM